MPVMDSKALAENNKALWDGTNQFWLDEFAKFDFADAMAWTFAAEQRKMAMVGSDTDLAEFATSVEFEPGKAKSYMIKAASFPPVNRVKPREAMTEYATVHDLAKSADFQAAYIHKEYGLGLVLTDEGAPACNDKAEEAVKREMRLGTGQPLTATQVAEMQRAYERADIGGMHRQHECSYTDGCDCAWCGGQSPSLADQLKARIRGLQDRLDVANKAFSLALTERDKLMHGETALKKAVDCFTMAANGFRAERDKLLEDNELKAIAIEALTQANKELTAQLAELKAVKTEPKPNTRDTSRLGHFGQAQTNQGLALFDRYY